MSYKDTLICTVGASLITNANRNDASDELKKVFSEYQLGNLAEVTRVIKNIKNPKEKQWGAEINSVASLLEKGYLDARQKIFLLVSDTPQGEMVGNILKEFFLENQNDMDFKSAKVIKIEKLNDKNRYEFRTQGLRNLVREMANCARENANRAVINATGGYKATIAYATLLGQVLNLPVYYLFEGFDEIIQLLPLPVSFDSKTYKNHSKIFAALEYLETIKEDYFLKKFSYHSWAEVPNELKIFIDRVEIDNERYLALNPLGQIYLESVDWDCSTIEDPDYKTNKSSSEKIAGSGGHAMKVRQKTEKIIEEIAQLPWVNLVSSTGSSEIEGGSSRTVWIEGDHLKIALSSKAGTGFFIVQTTCKSHRFLECVKQKIQKILDERR
ncbi:putative CRISPR-associated protein [Pseudothermotoga sp. U03pept]|uniref:putative CRISPR-associated protein n=1 Tax=Pseudothermotoga sp. U03pept TaxID=3447012 RepID=UPI003F01CDE7